MRRRLTAKARREEIIAIAHEVIVTEGARSLSLRLLARRCGMSAPGLMHHFPDLKSLLEAVLLAREERDVAAIATLAGPNPTTLDVLDAAVRHYSSEAATTMRFDALEPRRWIRITRPTTTTSVVTSARWTRCGR